MSTYAAVAQEVTDRLNRDDCTPQLIAYFVAEATRQIQRDVHLPSTEKSRLILAQGPVTFVSVPDDLLEVIDLYAGLADTGPPRALDRMAFRQLSAISDFSHPHAYARLGNVFQIRGAVPTGGSILITYYGQATPLVAPTDSNELTSAAPDLLVYGALAFAGDHFEHPNAQAWLQRYQAILTSVQSDQIRLDNTGGPTAIQSPYHNAWSQE